ncbi:hypothetical protein Ancab_012796 [Ancistrocladus abbreviatus]
MAKPSHLMSAKNINPSTLHPSNAKPSFLIRQNNIFTTRANPSRRNQRQPFLISCRKASRGSPRRLVTVSTSSGNGRWPGKWTCDYIFSLKDLHLEDLAEDGRFDTQVSVTLSLQKHAGFGLSVDGRIVTSIARRCSNCSSPYCSQIDTNFDVWVLPSSKDDRAIQLPEIGGDDPSVIYVKPGCEADLDSLIQDTIRLQTSVKGTCSESCEKSEPKLHYIGAPRMASLDKRWSRLLELRKS